MIAKAIGGSGVQLKKCQKYSFKDLYNKLQIVIITISYVVKLMLRKVSLAGISGYELRV